MKKVISYNLKQFVSLNKATICVCVCVKVKGFTFQLDRLAACKYVKGHLNLLLDFIPQMNSSVWSCFCFEHWVILLAKVHVYVYANLE